MHVMQVRVSVAPPRSAREVLRANEVGPKPLFVQRAPLVLGFALQGPAPARALVLVGTVKGPFAVAWGLGESVRATNSFRNRGERTSSGEQKDAFPKRVPARSARVRRVLHPKPVGVVNKGEAP